MFKVAAPIGTGAIFAAGAATIGVGLSDDHRTNAAQDRSDINYMKDKRISNIYNDNTTSDKHIPLFPRPIVERYNTFRDIFGGGKKD